MTANAQLLKLLGRNRGAGVGTRYEYGRFSPEITSRLQLDGRFHLLNSYLFYEENTLNAVVYPTRGRKIEAEIGGVYRQRPDFRVLDGDVEVGTEESPNFSFKPYGHSRLHVEQYLPLTKRGTLLLQARRHQLELPPSHCQRLCGGRTEQRDSQSDYVCRLARGIVVHEQLRRGVN